MSSGNGKIELLNFAQSPRRVVSLVPSMTDSLYELGAAEAIVGVTDFCPAPPADIKPPAIVGGTKSPDTDAIVALEPDLVIANQEENARRAVEALEEAGLKVWLTFPRSVEDVIRLLYTLIQLFRLTDAVQRVRTLEQTVEWSQRAVPEQGVRTFIPVWYQQESAHGPWWMTVSGGTYVDDVVRHCHGDNVFSQRKRRYPLAADLGEMEAEDAGERDVRYPRVRPAEVVDHDPQVILLPSEPFAFDESHRNLVKEQFGGTAAVRAERIHLVDGSLLTWHGTRLARALSEIPPLLAVEGEANGST